LDHLQKNTVTPNLECNVYLHLAHTKCQRHIPMETISGKSRIKHPHNK